VPSMLEIENAGRGWTVDRNFFGKNCQKSVEAVQAAVHPVSKAVRIHRRIRSRSRNAPLRFDIGTIHSSHERVSPSAGTTVLHVRIRREGMPTTVLAQPPAQSGERAVAARRSGTQRGSLNPGPDSREVSVRSNRHRSAVSVFPRVGVSTGVRGADQASAALAKKATPRGGFCRAHAIEQSVSNLD
jgi:hypothetical protein